MTAGQVDIRIEKKFLVEAHAWPFYEKLLKRNFKIRHLYPTQKMFNRYFDTEDDSFLAQHLRGVMPRRKYRLRIYEQAVRGSIAGYELKEKNGSMTRKTRWDLPASRVDEALRSNRPLIQPKEFASLTYRLENDYEREYFCTPTGLRVTIDKELTFRAGGMTLLFPYVIVEVKAPEAEAPAVAEFISQWPLEAKSFSKYVSGRLLLEGRTHESIERESSSPGI